MSTFVLPDCPKCMECSITTELMKDPVFAKDGHSYDRSAIEKWFASQTANGGSTRSPLTNEIIVTKLTPNLSLKTQIKEWVEKHTQGRAATQEMESLKGKVFSVKTSDDALSLVRQISELVTKSTFCILGPTGVERLKGWLQFSNLMTEELSTMLDVLATQCQHEIQMKQARHLELEPKCEQLQAIKNTLKSEQTVLKEAVAAMATKELATKADVVLLQEELLVTFLRLTGKVDPSRVLEVLNTEVGRRQSLQLLNNYFDMCNSDRDGLNQEFLNMEKLLETWEQPYRTGKEGAEAAETEHEEAKAKLVAFNVGYSSMERLCSEYCNEKDMIEHQLGNVNAEESSSSSSSSS